MQLMYFGVYALISQIIVHIKYQNIVVLIRFKLFITTTFFFVLSSSLMSQVQTGCDFTNQYLDDFEYGTQIPDVIPGALTNPTPSKLASYPTPDVGKGFYMTFANDITDGSIIMDREYTICQNSDFQFNAWIKEISPGGYSIISFVIRDELGVIIHNVTPVTYTAGEPWVNVTIGPIQFTQPTASIRLQIIYSGGMGNNKLGMDDLALQYCAPTPSQVSVNVCTDAPELDLFDYIVPTPPLPPVNDKGVWTGLSTLGNGYLGTFFPDRSLGGDYIYTIPAKDPLCPDTANQVTVVLASLSSTLLGNDTILCSGDSIILDVTSPHNTYLWSTGRILPKDTIKTAGTYSVTTTNFCGSSSDEIVISPLEIPLVDIGKDTILCNGESLTISSPSKMSTYLWSTGDTDPSLTVNKAGAYRLTTTNLCGNASDQISVTVDECHIYYEMPNIFTPNNDGENDVFGPISTENVTIMTSTFQVFNRWGQTLKYGTFPDVYWDGSDQSGQAAPNGTYYWVMTYSDATSGTQVQKGNITLMR